MFVSDMAGAILTEDGKLDDETLSKETERRLPNMNIEDPTRRIWVFTTASLPWMTGTAVNPLLRAAYLTRGRDKGKVTLGVPWLESDDQAKIFPKDKRYAKAEDQEAYVREWLAKAGLEEESIKLDLVFYPARYHEAYGSIFPMGDLAALVPDDEADVCVLEEPEHLNFFRAEGVPWIKKFEYVVGIIHTNYQFYARGEKHGVVKKPIVHAACAFTVRAHCHRVIKLSDALQDYAREKEMVENVHGVRSQFFEVGDRSRKECFTADAYFIGKVLWSKGIDILLALMRHHRGDLEEGNEKDREVDKDAPFPITIFGNGSDLDEVKQQVEELELPVTFHDAIDHAELGQYKVFVNPSQSEVLCTTIAEALAMQKWVVCARHPSNEFFFENFESCLSFADEQEFLECMNKALSEEPPMLSLETLHKLSWAAATDRFLAAASRPEVPGRNSSSKSVRGLARLDKLLASLHQQLMRGRGGDKLRQALGAGPVAKQAKHARKLKRMEGAGGSAVSAGVVVDDSSEDSEQEQHSETAPPVAPV